MITNVVLLPVGFTLENYAYVFTNNAILNSFLISVAFDSRLGDVEQLTTYYAGNPVKMRLASGEEYRRLHNSAGKLR